MSKLDDIFESVALELELDTLLESIDEKRSQVNLSVLTESGDGSGNKSIIQKILSPIKNLFKSSISAIAKQLESLKKKKDNVKKQKVVTEATDPDVYFDSLRVDYNDVVYIATQDCLLLNNVHDLINASSEIVDVVNNIIDYVNQKAKLNIPNMVGGGPDGKGLKGTTLKKGHKIGSGMFDDRVYSYSIVLKNLRDAELALTDVNKALSDPKRALFSKTPYKAQDVLLIKDFTKFVSRVLTATIKDMRNLGSFQASNLPVFDKRTSDGKKEGPLDMNIKDGAKTNTESVTLDSLSMLDSIIESIN